MHPKTEDSRNQRPFFTEFETYVLVKHHPDGRQTLSADETQFGMVVGCYLSPMHAAIDASFGGKIQMQVVSARSIDPQMFRWAEGNAVLANIRLGWPVINGKIVLREDAGLATYSQLLCVISRAPTTMEVGEILLGDVDRLYERAGLFAWRETCANLPRWDEKRFARAVANAVKSVRTTPWSDSTIQELALFDPEFERWHFIPCPESAV